MSKYLSKLAVSFRRPSFKSLSSSSEKKDRASINESLESSSSTEHDIDFDHDLLNGSNHQNGSEANSTADKSIIGSDLSPSSYAKTKEIESEPSVSNKEKVNIEIPAPLVNEVSIQRLQKLENILLNLESKFPLLNSDQSSKNVSSDKELDSSTLAP